MACQTPNFQVSIYIVAMNWVNNAQFWVNLAHFRIGKGPVFGTKYDLGKSLP